MSYTYVKIKRIRCLVIDVDRNRHILEQQYDRTNNGVGNMILHYFQHKWPVNPIIDFVKTQIKKNWILAWLLGLLHRFMRDKNVIQDESKLKKNKIGRYLFT